MRRLAIIPARGGSKRIPRKNIKEFLGKPIIAYSIEAALQSKLFDVVMVSTDDKEIARIARNYGAVVPFFRSKENSNDYAKTSDVLIEVINEFKTRGDEFKIACCIYPTAPFITATRLIEACKQLEINSFDTVLPIVKFNFPIQRALTLNESNEVNFLFKRFTNSRSQDLEITFHDAGQFYCFNVVRFMSGKSIWTKNTGAVVLSELEVQDIDTIEDWEIAEIKYKVLLA